MKKNDSKSKEFIELCKKYDVDPANVPELMSFEACCARMNYDPEKVIPDVSVFPARHQNALIGTAKLFIIHEAFNYDDKKKKVYEPDWNDRSERKWSYWWDMEKDTNNPSGFRFGGTLCAYPNTDSGGGSRLCNINEDIDIFIAKHFTELFRDIMVFPK
jgi:hypothetical protein